MYLLPILGNALDKLCVRISLSLAVRLIMLTHGLFYSNDKKVKQFAVTLDSVKLLRVKTAHSISERLLTVQQLLRQDERFFKGQKVSENSSLLM